MNITNLLKSSEGKKLEFKQNLSSHEGILRTIVAFSNTAGGTLLIGIEDKTKSVVGVDEPLDMEERLANIVNDGMEPKVIPNVEIIPWRKKYLIAIEIFPSSIKPHYLKAKGLEKGCYIRIGSSNRLADQILIKELQRSTNLETYDEQAIPELDSEAIDFRAASELFAEHRELKKSDLETLKLLVKYQERMVPTNAGIILFGKNREKHFSDAWIQAGRFKGVNKKDIIDSIEIHSYPVLAVKEAIEFVQKHSMKAMKIETIERTDEWNVPLLAVREAIINAVVHTDYAQRGSPIRIAIFDDRIEIENPGLIPFTLTIEDLYRGISKLRNPVIGRVFHELKLIERWGSGITRMTSVCEEAGLDRPLLEEIGVNFRVTLFLTRRKRMKLDHVDEAILGNMKNTNGLSTQQISTLISLSPRSTRTRLIKLIGYGLVVEIGSGPNDSRRRYFLKGNEDNFLSVHPQFK